jgi:hypothetical protein
LVVILGHMKGQQTLATNKAFKDQLGKENEPCFWSKTLPLTPLGQNQENTCIKLAVWVLIT